MKMLGQDLHTQEEFDNFKLKEFDKLVSKVEKLEINKKWIVALSLFAIIQITVDVLLLMK